MIKSLHNITLMKHGAVIRNAGKVSDGFVITLGVSLLVIFFGIFIVSGNVPLWYPIVLVGLIGAGVFVAKKIHNIVAPHSFLSFVFRGRTGVWVALLLYLFTFFGGGFFLPLWLSTIIYPIRLVCQAIPFAPCGLLAMWLSPIVWGVGINIVVFLLRKGALIKTDEVESSF